MPPKKKLSLARSLTLTQMFERNQSSQLNFINYRRKVNKAVTSLSQSQGVSSLDDFMTPKVPFKTRVGTVLLSQSTFKKPKRKTQSIPIGSKLRCVCRGLFYDKPSLDRHKQAVKNNRGCPICNIKKFQSQTVTRLHAYLHFEVDNKRCIVCDSGVISTSLKFYHHLMQHNVANQHPSVVCPTTTESIMEFDGHHYYTANSLTKMSESRKDYLTFSYRCVHDHDLIPCEAEFLIAYARNIAWINSSLWKNSVHNHLSRKRISLNLNAPMEVDVDFKGMRFVASQKEKHFRIYTCQTAGCKSKLFAEVCPSNGSSLWSCPVYNKHSCKQ